MQNRERPSVTACLKIMALVLSAGVIISCAAEKYSSSLTKIKQGKFRGTEISCKTLKTKGKIVASTPYPRQRGTARRLPPILRESEAQLSYVPRKTGAGLSYVPRWRGQGVDPSLLYIATPQNLPALPESSEITLLALTEATLPKSDDLNQTSVTEEHTMSARALPATSEITLVINDKKRDHPFRMSECLFYLAALSAGMIVLGAAGKTRRISDVITLWAARNPWKTRIMVGGIHVALGTVAYLFGSGLAEKGILFSGFSKYLLTASFLALAITYPVKKYILPYHGVHDMAMTISAFLMLANAGNTGMDMRPSAFGLLGNDNSVRIASDNIQGTSHAIIYNANVVNDKQPLQTPDTANEKTGKGKRFFLLVLAILGFLVLAYLLLAACCGIWCNGMEALAIFLGAIGGAFIIWLLVKIIKHIYSKEKSGEEPTASFT